jgi:hypothetical protein
LGFQSGTLDHIRAPVTDHDIGPRDRSSQQSGGSLGRAPNPYRSLTSVERNKAGGVIRARRRRLRTTEPVAGGALDLVDARTQVTQAEAGERTGETAGEL